ncbi:transcriptional repressor LexA [Anaerofustis stercorihominis]|uniref:transcriptional repressor LexA n=1 Tax=Anaerofustis stercorihominis TaxID=214853 RepID=UPI0021091F3B|nr:transcriptional repressor LexA [Anaerofustis stercorihominis]MCQ4794175.1 transcriptional repressor LexA [Anaerofustis stercorihominis]
MRSKSIDLMNEIKNYVEQFYLSHYQSPTITQIANEIGIARSTAYRYLVEMDEKRMLEYDGKTVSTKLISQSNPKLIRAAVLGNVSCGLPNLAEENIEEYVSLPESLFGSGEFYLLKASGESMIEAGIDNGDLVVIRKQSRAEEGEIVVALVDDEATLKRFYRDNENERIVLHPENKTMSDIYVDNCIIQGIAVKVIKNLQ